VTIWLLFFIQKTYTENPEESSPFTQHNTAAERIAFHSIIKDRRKIYCKEDNETKFDVIRKHNKNTQWFTLFSQSQPTNMIHRLIKLFANSQEVCEEEKKYEKWCWHTLWLYSTPYCNMSGLIVAVSHRLKENGSMGVLILSLLSFVRRCLFTVTNSLSHSFQSSLFTM
jgi:hypothetical protein